MKHAILAGTLALACGLPAAASDRQSMGFDLDIALSAKATDRLRATREGITVSARYYGDPAKRAEKYANEVGQIDLGGETLRLPGHGGRAHVSGKKVLAGRLGWIERGAKVNVNVFSSRLSNQDNVLACDFIDGDVAQIVKMQPLVLHCSLIEENAQTELKPKPP